MMGTNQARLRVPKVMAATGSLIALATWFGQGWKAAFSIEVLVAVLTIGYYMIGKKESDLGAEVGSRPDERQLSNMQRASGLAGMTMVVTVLVGFMVMTAMKRSAWEFEASAVVGGLSFLVGLAVYSERG